MGEKRYKVYAKKADFRGLGDKYNIDPVVIKVLTNRGVTEDKIENYIKPSLDNIHDPYLFENMKETVELIIKHVLSKKKIYVVSDYDVDGVCSGFILSDYLCLIGGEVVNIIPDRIKDGYGINKNHIDIAFNDGASLIITTDNGIAAIEAVSYAKEKGLDVIVTDHHEVPKVIDENGDSKYIYPEADYIINHKVPDCKYPFKDMCGTGVAYKLILAINEYIKLSLDTSFDSKFDEYIQFVALATVCDIVSLTDENRDMVSAGLKLMKNTKNLGLKSLIEATGIKKDSISSYHLGFILGPCVNSSGRLDTANLSLELFKTSDEQRAKKIASELAELNNERKDMTEKNTKIAVDMAANDTNNILVLYLEDCHESIAGIVAGRVKEVYYKPVIVFAGKASDGIIKGSARSIDSFNIFDGITKVKDLTVKFGGHKMAAGLSIKYDDLKEFRTRINSENILSEEDLIETIYIDCKMPLDYISYKLIDDLSVLEPFGKDNNKAIFGLSNIKVKKIQIFGANNNVLRFDLITDSGKIVSAVMFTDAFAKVALLEEKYGKNEVNKALAGKDNNVRINILYYPMINEFRDVKSIQVNITNLVF
ncbi:single-stranded-DNA-specific exonuclease [Eubacterium uniforme]|uniref:Single-stranded-DNA-specific exonuclease RecJ n=1 Tax=Eubacterium uniforme TaxID=39495 RepID=A0A1T4V479_9FIRM|nr:single-stranded-DNA-specific exonuclease RecJ [Eubacterium uniforme]SKA59674.1 single-stranded-DNA-specific exonuclease [Eubacterium uniforme]